MNSSVALVLDRKFTGSIGELALQMPVWIISSTENDAAVEKVRSSSRVPRNITSFLPLSGEKDGDALLRALYEIDEHHGPASSVQPYSQIMVYGSAPEFVTPTIAKELGLEVRETHPGGFSLQRHASFL